MKAAPLADLFALAEGLLAHEETVWDAAATAIDAWIRAASVEEIERIGIAARGSFRQARGFAEAARGEARLGKLPASAATSVSALLSMHRSGYIRELAVRHLATANDDLVVPFLLLRADDIVPSTRSLAEAAISARLDPAHTAALARSLGIVEVLRRRQRGAGGPLVRAVDDWLLQDVCREALVVASDASGLAVRRAALRLRLRAGPRRPVLERALSDGDTGIRLWAARAAATSPNDADKRALVPLLEASRSAWTRLLGLRARAKLDVDDGPLERALLDPHAAVRYAARTLLRARHPERAFGETRRAALAVLGDPRVSTAAVVGSLGALADVGLAVDVGLLARFVVDPRARVRIEARRTLEHLAPSG